MQKRQRQNVVTVAQANKMARAIWTMLAYDMQYQKNYVSVKPNQSRRARLATKKSSDSSNMVYSWRVVEPTGNHDFYVKLRPVVNAADASARKANIRNRNGKAYIIPN